jgi:ABC-type antimicrobial peptide transport system permease subunit
LRDLRQEIGVLRATGWRAWEILEKVALENLTVSLISVCIAVLISMSWIKGLNGVLIAQFYVAEVGLVPVVDIPSRTLPAHVFFCLVLALGVTQVGGLVSVCTKLMPAPGESMR